MPNVTQEATLVTRIAVRSDATKAFAEWQSEWHAKVASFPGFISLEILSPDSLSNPEWVLIQRFIDMDALHQWRRSQVKNEVFKELQPLLDQHRDNPIHEEEKSGFMPDSGVTEVFVTHVAREKASDYEKWIAKVHQIEAKFPGFKKVFVQSPKDDSGSWITLLQFDSSENLDRWLSSKERQEVLNESKEFVKSIENHRVISSFAGWFGDSSGGVPPVWKQTMLVLLVLFPIVMLEMRFLSPFTSHLNKALGMFIGNAVSVSLVSWPTLPLVIRFLGWWLTPEPMNKTRDTILGALVVIGLYILEIALLWNLV